LEETPKAIPLAQTLTAFTVNLLNLYKHQTTPAARQTAAGVVF
jgi:hypothetical protein